MNTKIAAMYSLLLVGTICVVATNQTNRASAGTKKPWTPENAVAAFTDALTKAGYDAQFRSRLTASPASAKEAVSELAGVDIPADVVMGFYDNNAEQRKKFQLFVLPKLNENSRTKYEYKSHIECCYNVWLTTNVPPEH